ncbi:unnamed protein product, partial [Hapterophycus canaliculatus]
LDHFRHVPAAPGSAEGEGEEVEGHESGDEDRNTFQQRYFVCREYWGPANGDDGGITTATNAASSDGQDGSVDDRSGQRDSGGGAASGSAKAGGGSGRGAEHAAPGALGPIFFYVSFVFLFSVFFYFISSLLQPALENPSVYNTCKGLVLLWTW